MVVMINAPAMLRKDAVHGTTAPVLDVGPVICNVICARRTTLTIPTMAALVIHASRGEVANGMIIARM